jgi:hypothetical protein
MVTISISADALAAITTTLPDGLRAQARPDGKGGYLDIVCHAGRVSIRFPRIGCIGVDAARGIKG